MTIRVLIVDDDALVRTGLSMMLAGADDLQIVAEADGFGEDFVEAQRLGDRAADLRHFEHVR